MRKKKENTFRRSRKRLGKVKRKLGNKNEAEDAKKGKAGRPKKTKSKRNIENF